MSEEGRYFNFIQCLILSLGCYKYQNKKNVKQIIYVDADHAVKYLHNYGLEE